MHVRIITTPDELFSLSSQWKQLADQSQFPTICSNDSFLRAWWRAFGKRLSLRVVVVEERGEVRLIAPFYTSPDAKELRLLGDHWADFNSIVFRDGDRDSIEVLRHWLRSQNDWSKVQFKYLPINSLLLEPYQSAPPSSTPFIKRLYTWSKLDQPTAFLDVYDNFPFVDLTTGAEFGKLLERTRYRRHVNWFNRQGRLTYQCFTDYDACSALLPEYFALHRKEWNAREKSGKVPTGATKLSSWFDNEATMPSSPLPLVPSREYFQFLIEELCPQGIVRFDVLALDDRPIAILLNFVERGSLNCFRICHDPEFHSHSPGRLLLCYALRQAVESGQKRVDLGAGYHSYKLDYASDIGRTATLTLYRTAAHAAHEGLRSLARRVRG